MQLKCFVCDRRLGRNPARAECEDDQVVLVGSECFKLIKAAGDAGYQPQSGGPRLYLLGLGYSKTHPEKSWFHTNAPEYCKCSAHSK